MDGLQEWTPETGTPQGAVISPLLANIYLNPLDHLMAAAGLRDGALRGRLRDPVSQHARKRNEPWRWCRSGSADNGLTLHPTRRGSSMPGTEGFDFLGYHFDAAACGCRGRRAWTKLKDTIRAKTRRTDGHSLPAIIATLNRTLRGWFGYFQHSYRTRLRGPGQLDSRRGCGASCASAQGRRGRGRGADHQRWPNAFFAEQGLFSLTSGPWLGSVNPLRGKTTNWRAGCGKSARPVRREGERTQSALPTPIPGLIAPFV